MSTAANTPSTPQVTPPTNAAKGPKRGQTTLAAEIDRWQALADNLAPQVDQTPGLKDPLAQFQVLLTQAKAIRNQLNTLQADTATALAQRNQLLVDGGALFARLSLILQGVHGPRSPRLREFGLKPRRLRTGRPRTKATPTPAPGGVTLSHAPATEPGGPAAPTTTAVATTVASPKT